MDVPLVDEAILSAGGNPGVVENRQPSRAINHIICLYGTYPSRN